MVPADPYKGGPTGPGSTAGLGGSFGAGASGSHKPIKGISSYKGVPVIVLPIDDNAFSFGFIFVGDEVNDPSVIQHEYGHAVHLSQIGIKAYTMLAFIPSLIGFWSNVPYDDYYSQPHEYVADVFGRVNRDSGNYNYLPYTQLVSALYWITTFVARVW